LIQQKQSIFELKIFESGPALHRLNVTSLIGSDVAESYLSSHESNHKPFESESSKSFWVKVESWLGRFEPESSYKNCWATSRH